MKKIIYWLFVKIIAPFLKVSFTKDDFSYSILQKTIYIATKPIENDYGFARHIEEKHFFAEVYNFSAVMWAILHEIGHYFTIDYCVEDDRATRALCALFDNPPKAIQDLYFDLESEYEATEWAINYVNAHTALCKLFSKMC